MCMACSMKARKSGRDVSAAVALIDQAEAGLAEARKRLERAGVAVWAAVQGHAIALDILVCGCKVSAQRAGRDQRRLRPRGGPAGGDAGRARGTGRLIHPSLPNGRWWAAGRVVSQGGAEA